MVLVEKSSQPLGFELVNSYSVHKNSSLDLVELATEIQKVRKSMICFLRDNRLQRNLECLTLCLLVNLFGFLTCYKKIYEVFQTTRLVAMITDIQNICSNFNPVFSTPNLCLSFSHLIF